MRTCLLLWIRLRSLVKHTLETHWSIKAFIPKREMALLIQTQRSWSHSFQFLVNPQERSSLIDRESFLHLLISKSSFLNSVSTTEPVLVSKTQQNGFLWSHLMILSTIAVFLMNGSSLELMRRETSILFQHKVLPKMRMVSVNGELS